MSWRETSHNFGLLWLRLCLGAGMTYHGFGKIFGGRMDRFAEGVESMGFPEPMLFAWIAALSEFLGGILVIVGFGTRPAALFIFGTMGVAAFVRHAADPLSVKELALTYWAMSAALLFTGAGPWSFDAKRPK